MGKFVEIQYMPSMHEILGSPPHSRGIETVSKEYEMKIHQDHAEKSQREVYSLTVLNLK